MYYHASSVKGITQLTPQSSNHGIPLVYFSTKRENVLVYLSNSIEKYCVETGFSYNEEMNDKMKAWNKKTILEEYENASNHPEYRHFLKGNFSEILCGR